MRNTALGLSILLITFLIGYLVVPSVIERAHSVPGQRPELVATSEIGPDTANEWRLIETKSDQLVDAEYEPDREDPSKSKGNLVWVSVFHSELFPYKNGSKWMGLFKDGSKYVTRPAALKVSKIDEPELHDLKVSTTRKGESLFLVKGLSYIHEAEIPTLFAAEWLDGTDILEKAKDRTFNYKGRDYVLSLEIPGGEDIYSGKGAKLILKSNGVEQTLRYSKNGCNDCSWSLLWVGDLDLDGKLDFFMQLSGHYNVEDRVLFVSSQASEGKLVKHVADFYSVGC